jgi:hypothetical protein
MMNLTAYQIFHHSLGRFISCYRQTKIHTNTNMLVVAMLLSFILSKNLFESSNN